MHIADKYMQKSWWIAQSPTLRTVANGAMPPCPVTPDCPRLGREVTGDISLVTNPAHTSPWWRPGSWASHHCNPLEVISIIHLKFCLRFVKYPFYWRIFRGPKFLNFINDSGNSNKHKTRANNNECHVVPFKFKKSQICYTSSKSIPQFAFCHAKLIHLPLVPHNCVV